MVVVNTFNCKYDVVRECCKKLGFRVSDDELEPWVLFWIDTGVSVERVLAMQPYSFINHFPGMHEICRKDCLARNLGRLSRSFPKDGNFFPRTWILPLEWGDLKAAHQAASRRRPCYIVKPDHGCQGKGISLLSSPDDLVPMLKALKGPNNLIVQTYLTRPCLINDYKFDLRVYVLVTSVKPLRIFLYRDGLARFATEPYRVPRDGNLGNVCMHLTNYAINKNSEKFDHAPEDDKGSKRSIKSVLQYLTDVRGPLAVEMLWRRIGEVVIKTLLTIQPQLSRNMQACFPSCDGRSKQRQRPQQTDTGAPNVTEEPSPRVKTRALQSSQCFEILGFDIFVDHKLKPWVLEVNHSPSFTCDTPLDDEIKSGVIGDALQLLNIRAANPKRFCSNQKRKAKKRLLAFSSPGNVPLPPASPLPLPRSRQAAASPAETVTESLASSASASLPVMPDSRDKFRQPSAHPDLFNEANEAVEKYYHEFPPRELAKLEAFEDLNLGQYQRIYPPKEHTKLAHFLLLQKEAANIFSETISTKRRREFLQNKKKEEELKAQKIESWRLRQREKTRSMPSLSKSFSTDTVGRNRYVRAGLRRSVHGVASSISLSSRPASASFAGYKKTGLVGQRDSLPMSSESTKQSTGGVSGEDSSQSKQLSTKSTIKLNVESINERFLSGLVIEAARRERTIAEQRGIPAGLARSYDVAQHNRGRQKTIAPSCCEITSESDAGMTRIGGGYGGGGGAGDKGVALTPDPREAFDRYEFIQRMQSALQELQKSKGGSTHTLARSKPWGRRL
ncbi:Tubulin polyglutamylase ttll6 [Geranomyces variabilis]|uniref:Tubulin polyglutamylase ttll6 n=1 Tax=Geranomyces variabilis TaxID=109894 RepID=A0AAD5TFV5_9FUNG|nr:Tubulin polyglutamylase ttll6 [Geranomyces variabilis]